MALGAHDSIPLKIRETTEGCRYQPSSSDIWTEDKIFTTEL